MGRIPQTACPRDLRVQVTHRELRPTIDNVRVFALGLGLVERHAGGAPTCEQFNRAPTRNLMATQQRREEQVQVEPPDQVLITWFPASTPNLAARGVYRTLRNETCRSTMDSATRAAVDVNWRKCGANVGKLSKLAALWLAV
jgi:hypothetical protein